MAQEPLSSWRITWEGLKLPTKNLKLTLTIFLITLFFTSTIYLANFYLTYPVLFDLIKSLIPTPPSPPKDPKPLIAKLVILECIIIVQSFILSYCILIITVNATAVTYLRPQATLKELYTRVKRTWKGPLITQLLVGVLSFACMFVILVMVIFFSWIANNSLISRLLGFAIVFLVLFLYVREAIVWYFAVVISVIEDGYYGMKAIVRAKELIEGRRRQWVAITALIFLPGLLVIGIVNATVGSTEKSVIGGLLMSIVSLVLNMVTLAAHTVFYYDCKKSRGEDMVLSTEEGILYTSVPSDGHAKGDVV